MPMPSWRPDDYLRFEQERTRPCRDLVHRIPVDRPRTVIDLGCGPGNSTAVLAERWPSADITGLDSSAEMLERAHATGGAIRWITGDIEAWAGSTDKSDIVFSNAALQWVTNHAELYPRLLERVSDGGALAIQVPANLDAPAQRMMRQVAASPAWRNRFSSAKVRDWFVHDAAFYYDLLAGRASTLDLWTTEYIHIMPGVEAITEWYRATGLRPFLEVLTSDADRQEFLNDYTDALRREYIPRQDGRVLFPFRRLFLIARR